MKLTTLAVLVLTIALSSCDRLAPLPTSTASDAPPVKDLYSIRYKGTLPCADCPGIVTEIGLYDDSLNYIEKDTYLERSNSIERKGSYTVVKGYKGNENQLMLVLDEQDGRDRKFLQLNDSTLLMLDGKGEIIDAGEKYQLQQVKQP